MRSYIGSHLYWRQGSLVGDVAPSKAVSKIDSDLRLDCLVSETYLALVVKGSLVEHDAL